jgi:DNA mismatch repair protein MutL
VNHPLLKRVLFTYMNRIKILPDSVKRKIAAGEVVEGPFSVVKELIENSLDAGSTEIDVEVQESGLKRILVRDNGIGIFREDLPLSVREYATSKIEHLGDIDRILSYGFRGEALSSISSISQLTILTKSPDEDSGSRLMSSDGSVEIHDYAGPNGTTVIVENLYYNVPARKKFLKARSTELRRVRETFLRIALSNPGVSFSFSVDGKRQITLPSSDEVSDRIQQIYGEGILDKLYFDRMRDIKVEISGYLSKPDSLKSSRSMQILFVNKRPVEYRYLGYLLSRAYEAIAAKGQHPVALLFIDIDPSLIDVNIHPAKKEIKFFDQGYIDKFIIHLSRKVLNRVHIARDVFKPGLDSADKVFGDAVEQDNDPSSRQLFLEGESIRGDSGEGIENRDDYSHRKEPFRSFIRDVSELYSRIEEGGFRVLGIVFNSYIMAEDGLSIIIIDFHAAHERIIFDSLMRGELYTETQEIMFPRLIELSVEDYLVIQQCLPLLKEIGFDIEGISDNSVIIRGVPTVGRGIDVEAFFCEVVDSLKSERDIRENMRRMIFEKVACHSAKRSHDDLTEDDIILIIRASLSGMHDLRCPHGRPYVYRIEKKDLERIFKRT